MTNHPNRGRRGPASNPRPEEVRQARLAAELTQTQAAELVYSSLRAWQQWEAGDRRMHPAIWQWWKHQAAQIRPAAVSHGPEGE